MPAAALVGQLALGIGLVFLRPPPKFDDRTHDRVSLQAGERHAQLVEPVELHVVVEQQLDLVARRVRLHRSLGVAFERRLTGHAERAVSGHAKFPRLCLTGFSTFCALIAA